MTLTAWLCRVSDESGTLEMTPVNEMPLKKEHLDPYVSHRAFTVSFPDLEPINQSTSRWNVNQSINQSINRSINQLIN